MNESTTPSKEETVIVITKHRLECDTNTKWLLIVFMSLAAMLYLIVHSINVCHESTMEAFREGYSEVQQIGQQGTLWQKAGRR